MRAMIRRSTVTLRSTINAILFAATATLAPAPLFAQVTTFVAPPRKAVDSTKTTVAASTPAQRDTMTRMKLSDMRAWVDSAAGIGTASTQVAEADTSTAAVAQTTTSAVTNRKGTTTFSNGAIAPNTASSLPFFFAGGLVLIFVGVGTLRVAQARARLRNGARPRRGA
jgi:hypothetical protein